jgi:hexosaminidase
MKQLLFSLFILMSAACAAQFNIVPQPVKLVSKKGTFLVDHKIDIVYADANAAAVGDYLRDKIKKLYGYDWLNCEYHPYRYSKNILLSEAPGYLPKEGYKLEITNTFIRITGSKEGLFYGVQTLLQILPAEKTLKKSQKHAAMSIPCLAIEDYPRFPYRGMHLDVSRHFFPVDQVKKYIDYLAYHKFNTFHWHLTDDQGWRIEIKKYPKLTQVGSCRAQTLEGRYGSDRYDGTKYCGYYTQRQIKEVVKYAAERYITIIPEIEMPGHSLAALAAYPFLGCTKGPYKVMETWGTQDDVICAGNDSSYRFLTDVLDEVMALFPSKYIHIGGDECPKDRWKLCPVCQQRIKAAHLKDEHALQSYFVQRIEKHVNSKGRKIIGWDEILDGGLAPNATVMSWRGTAGGIIAAKQGHDVIMSPEAPLYFNHLQSSNEDSITQGGYNPLEAIYAYEPVPAELDEKEGKHILGAQGNVWTEYIGNPRKLEYMVFPRMSALAEVLWTPKEKRSWQSFEKRLPAIFQRYRFWGVHYSNAYYDLQPSVITAANGIAWQLATKNKEGKIVYVTGKERNATFDYTEPLPIPASGMWGAALTASGHSLLSSWVWQEFFVNKATGKKITLAAQPNSSYRGKGAFTLADGVQNDQGMVKSAQFLGFLGNDLEAVIDLDSIQNIQEISLHAFEQAGSWIYPPASVSFYTSNDGNVYALLDSLTTATGSKNLIYKIRTNTKARFVKVHAKNFGKIPFGSPGSGTNAWLFADEIEIK